MRLVPAIDIYEGSVVRLREGKFSQVTTYRDDPIFFAKIFNELGFKRLHLVDLGGAKNGGFDPQNLNLIEKIVSLTSLSLDFSGGVRNEKTALEITSAGASIIGIGSLAVTDPGLTKRILESLDFKCFIACDVKDELVRISGWTHNSGVPYQSFLSSWREFGLDTFLVTDISKDGMLLGSNLALYKNILEKFPYLKIMAGGGITSPNDITSLSGLEIKEAIIGRALIEERLDLSSLKRFIW